MKAIIKEICKREGLKSQTSIGNVREVTARLVEILADESTVINSPLTIEFLKCLEKKSKNKFKKIKKSLIAIDLTYKVEDIKK